MLTDSYVSPKTLTSTPLSLVFRSHHTPSDLRRPLTRYTSIARGRRPTVNSAEPSSAPPSSERTPSRTNSRGRPRPSTSSSSRRRPQTTSSRGSSQRRRPPPRQQEVEVTPGSRSNARRRRPQPARGQQEEEEPTEVTSSGRPNARRRPQYSSIQRNRWGVMPWFMPLGPTLSSKTRKSRVCSGIYCCLRQLPAVPADVGAG